MSRLSEFMREWERVSERERAHIRYRFLGHFGFRVTFTGKFTVDRKSLESLVVRGLAATIEYDASKTQTLFVGDLSRRGGTSLKLRTASAHGVPAFTETTLVERLWRWMAEAVEKADAEDMCVLTDMT